jgi:heat shock protein 1/8
MSIGRSLKPIKDALANHVYKIRDTINDKEIGDKIDATGRKKIEAAIKHVIHWLDTLDVIHHAEADEFEDKLIGLELICKPIFAKVCRQQ